MIDVTAEQADPAWQSVSRPDTKRVLLSRLRTGSGHSWLRAWFAAARDGEWRSGGCVEAAYQGKREPGPASPGGYPAGGDPFSIAARAGGSAPRSRPWPGGARRSGTGPGVMSG